MNKILSAVYKRLPLFLILCMLFTTSLSSIALAETEITPVTGVTLDQLELCLTEGGEGVVLMATVGPEDASNKTVTWSSSDEMVATVDNGLVTPLALGTTIITVTTVDGGYTATCDVTISEMLAILVPVTGITLDQSELSLVEKGEAGILTATVEPEDASDKTITWSSSDETIAVVSAGTITPVAVGAAIITATTADGAHTATCDIVVGEAQITSVPVTGITLDQPELSLTEGGEVGILTATVEPEDATNLEVIWSSSDEMVAIVDDGIVTPLVPGTAVITATTVDGEFIATCEVTINKALLMPTIALTGANPEHPLTRDESDEIIIDYAVNEDYPWYYSATYSEEGYDAYIAGNSFTRQANVSNIAFIVTGQGVFSFDYMTSTRGTGSGYALYYNINQPIDSSNYKSSKNYSNRSFFRGATPWTNEEVSIEPGYLDEQGQATVYIAYYRDNVDADNENMVAIANVCFISGRKQMALTIDNKDYGYVTDADNHTYSESENIINYESGDIVEFTAVPEDGARFYGWVDGDGRFLTTDETYSFMISSDTSLKAVFAADGHYAAHRNGEFYTDDGGGLAQALTDAQPGDIISMLENQTLSEDATVPSGAILYIPYSATFDSDGNADGSKDAGLYNASTKIATAAKTYRTLTINSGVTLTVNGTLNIGSIIGRPGQDYQGHTSGWHGKIENHGNIIIANEGVLDCWGIITGDGAVIAENGGVVCEPFIVYDFSGGSNTVDLYFDGQSPFKQYAMQNIQSQLVLHFGSRLYARCNLYASSAYNKTDAVFIGEGGLYGLKEGTVVTRTYDGGEYIDTNTDIGKATYVFDGGMNFASLSMPIAGAAISTEDVDFPIPYNWEIVLKDGECGVKGRIKFMPGATLRVESGADLTVSGTLFVLDGLIQSQMSGKYYPTTEELQSKAFSASGQLIANGTLTVEQGAIFGGIVQTETTNEDPATIIFQSGSILDSKDIKDGGKGAYNANTSIFDLPARAYIHDFIDGGYSLRQLYPGRTYEAYDSAVWTVDGYTMKYAKLLSAGEENVDFIVDGKPYGWTIVDVPLNESRIGSWDTAGYVYHNVQVVNKTIYDETDSTRTVVGDDNSLGEIESCGDVVFTVDITETGIGYGYQVTYVAGNADPIVLTADAEGQYTISEVKNDVTIIVTSCKLGDINFDGEIDNADLVQLRKTLAKILTPEDLQFIAADINRDGEIDNGDLVMLRKHLAKVIEIS
ncbi:MAG TPA: hypothetical protein GX723_11040 [Thermoanaerobacterales bacterium]|nr:hypothetical protein [Thermoanaerobacterales bacterium]